MTAETVARPAGTTATTIDSADRAVRLAEHLLDPKRTRPVVVVTKAAGQLAPYIQIDEIVSAVGELAEVYLMATGSITFALSDRLPDLTQVYGGAGRVYPVDRRWQGDPYAAPLRFAFGAAQGPAATDRLIADALGAVHDAGLSTKRAGATVRQVAGKVKALLATSRAWVRADDGGDAVIWHDLLIPGLPIERVFQVGMRITGSLDVEERRIDVAASLRKPGEALADYAVGNVVLGRVVLLDNIAATVELYPGVRVGISATEVTGNPIDRLTALMSIDEVLPVRVKARGGHDGRAWRLSMLDVEESEPIRPSPSLLPGGPPWLVLAAVPSETSTPPQLIERVEPAGQLDEPLPDAGPEETAQVTQGAELDQPVPQSQSQLQSQSQSQSQSMARAVQVERDGFREQTGELHARVQRLQQSVQKARTDLRTEKQKSQQLAKRLKAAKSEGNERSSGEVLFLDPETQFRYDVDVAYAHRIPAGDKATRVRRELRVGPDFLASLARLEGVDRSKVVAVTVEVITDLVNELDSRELHPLREGVGAAEHGVVRGDGARCMRVTLQHKTPSARRLHFWRVGAVIELSRVVKHDDMTP